MTRMLASLLLSASLAATLAAPARADACMQGNDIRAMVQAGKVIALSSVIGQINAVGQPVSSPQLCGSGGALYYQVDVVNGGQVVHLRVDAHTGAISR